MVTEADWKTWTPADLKPYVHEVLEIFGVDRREQLVAPRSRAVGETLYRYVA